MRMHLKVKLPKRSPSSGRKSNKTVIVDAQKAAETEPEAPTGKMLLKHIEMENIFALDAVRYRRAGARARRGRGVIAPRSRGNIVFPAAGMRVVAFN
ncbi:hypothetical protein EVAR_37559_1 [Eumeta japonica]|uniref:Uncharacterized protein n=1 Tax=Eumeta variegata TaxID=151549 RepID=A0A4C1XV50_EUMVA|nr:hypothetical protein EVAR_37559_1 [Eumeta japonica]